MYIYIYIYIYASLMLALGGKREGKRKGLASGLLECCIFPKKSKYLWPKGFWRFCTDKEKSLPLTIGFIPKSLDFLLY
jgi:hypothetical protein